MLAKPHCGLIASCSTGTHLLASWPPNRAFMIEAVIGRCQLEAVKHDGTVIIALALAIANVVVAIVISDVEKVRSNKLFH
jgi:hypothetical protein